MMELMNENVPDRLYPTIVIAPFDLLSTLSLTKSQCLWLPIENRKKNYICITHRSLSGVTWVRPKIIINLQCTPSHIEINECHKMHNNKIFNSVESRHLPFSKLTNDKRSIFIDLNSVIPFHVENKIKIKVNVAQQSQLELDKFILFLNRSCRSLKP